MNPPAKSSFPIWPLALACTCSALIIAAGIATQDFLWKKQVQSVTENRLRFLRWGGGIMQFRFGQSIQELLVLKNLAEQKIAQHPDATYLAEDLKKASELLMRTRGAYDDIRLLDRHGKELFRLTRSDESGHPPVEVAAEALQDRSSSSEFKEAIQAQSEKIILFGMALAHEYGELRTSAPPVVRLSGTVSGPDGQPFGVLAIHYSGNDLLRNIREDPSPYKGAQALNSDGFWLAGPDPASELAFMFPDRSQESLRIRKPAFWEKISRDPQGSFTENGILYCFRNLNIAGAGRFEPRVSERLQGLDRLRWTLLAEVPETRILAGFRTTQTILWLTCILAAFVPPAWIIAKAARRDRKASAEITKALSLLDLAVNTTLDGMLVLEPVKNAGGMVENFRCTLANKAARNIFGDDLKGGLLMDWLPQETGASILDHLREVVATGEPGSLEFSAQRRWFFLRSAQMKTGLVASLVDITDRKTAEDIARHSQALLRMAGTMAKVGGWEVEYPDLTVRWSEEVYHIHDVPLTHHPTPQEAFSYYPPESQEKLAEAFRKCREDGTPFDLSIDMATSKGKPLFVRAMGFADMRNGVTRRIYGTLQDITATRTAEEEHRRHLAQLERITANLPCAVYQYLVSADDKHSFVYVSERIREVYNRTPGELISDVERGYDLIHPDDVDRIRQSAHASHENRTQWRHEFRIFRGGEIRWILDQSVPEPTPDGGTLWAGFLMDITDQKAMQDEVIASRDAAEKASRAKGEFLAIMSHEIRTPLNGVLGFAEVLEKTSLNDQQRDQVRIIISSGETLLRILDDILDFSRIEAGRMEIEKSTFSPTKLVTGIERLLAPSAAEKTIVIHSQVAPDVPPQVVGDASRLRQVLFNLVGNAVKFTDSGTITIGCSLLDAGALGHRLEFSVEDTGAGIPEEKLAVIFDPFTQADTSISRRFGGAGLGLAIAQRLVLLMGGAINVKSSPGKGSRFSFLIPFGEPEIPGDAASAHSPVLSAQGFAERYPMRILVVEDDRVNLQLVRTILRQFGYEPATAANGVEAVSQFQSLRPDVILMDLHMPEMDGLEATRQIRAMESTGENGARPVFISALTADVLPREKTHAMASGMDEYVTKPVKIDILLRTLERAWNTRNSG